MEYVILDMEWNQRRFNPAQLNGKPFSGDIIQIGAVKLGPALNIVDTFKMLVRPTTYKRMDKKVSRLTGLTQADLAFGFPFPQALDMFRRWCGDDFCFLTWGGSDRAVLRENIAMYNCPDDWLPAFYDAQLIYGHQTSQPHRQSALLDAMEHFSETPLTSHDALNDVFNTLCVCRHLDIAAALKEYDKLTAGRGHDDPYAHSARYPSRSAALASEQVNSFACPACGKPVVCGEWVRKSTERKVTLAECDECSRYLVRLRFRRLGGGAVKATRTVHPLTDELMREYEALCLAAAGHGDDPCSFGARYASRAEALESGQLTAFPCPVCGKTVECGVLLKKGDDRKVAIAECEGCSRYFVRLRFRRIGPGVIRATRTFHPLTDDLAAEYDALLSAREQKNAPGGKHSSKRRRRRRRRSNSPLPDQPK